MCLYVKQSNTRKPIPFKKCFKMLQVTEDFDGKGFYTPFQDNLVPFGDGHFVARNATKPYHEWIMGQAIYEGFLHSGTQHDSWSTRKCKNTIRSKYYVNKEVVSFSAFALDVYAHGRDADMVSRGLYIPAMDVRNYTDAQLKQLKRAYPVSFTPHTATVLHKLSRQVC